MTSPAKAERFRRRQTEYAAARIESRRQLGHKPIIALAEVRHWIATFRRQGTRLLDGLQHGAGIGQVTADQHFLAVAAVHIVLAVDRANGLGWSLPTPPNSHRHRETLHLLRNIFEHWTEYTPWEASGFFRTEKARATARRLLKLWPGANPLSFQFDGTLGGCIPLAELDAYATEVLRAVNSADPGRVALELRVEPRLRYTGAAGYRRLSEDVDAVQRESPSR